MGEAFRFARLPIAGIFDVPCHLELGPAWAADEERAERTVWAATRYALLPTDRAPFRPVSRAIAAAVSSMLAPECWFRYSATQYPISSHSRSSSAGPFRAVRRGETSSRCGRKASLARDIFLKTGRLVARPGRGSLRRDRRRDPARQGGAIRIIFSRSSAYRKCSGGWLICSVTAPTPAAIGGPRQALPERTGCRETARSRQREGRRVHARPRGEGAEHDRQAGIYPPQRFDRIECRSPARRYVTLNAAIARTPGTARTSGVEGRASMARRQRPAERQAQQECRWPRRVLVSSSPCFSTILTTPRDRRRSPCGCRSPASSALTSNSSG